MSRCQTDVKKNLAISSPELSKIVPEGVRPVKTIHKLTKSVSAKVEPHTLACEQ